MYFKLFLRIKQCFALANGIVKIMVGFSNTHSTHFSMFGQTDNLTQISHWLNQCWCDKLVKCLKPAEQRLDSSTETQ